MINKFWLDWVDPESRPADWPVDLNLNYPSSNTKLD